MREKSFGLSSGGWKGIRVGPIGQEYFGLRQIGWEEGLKTGGRQLPALIWRLTKRTNRPWRLFPIYINVSSLAIDFGRAFTIEENQ